jgi:sialic acid synthase SpsE
MNKKFIVNGFEINNFRKPYIIAEACINHDGNIETAKKMVLIAKKSGADCIKFQIHNLKNEMLKETPKSNNFTESLWDTLEKTNITIDNQKILKSYCEHIGIQYLCTPFSKDGIDELESINVDFYKIGSGEMTNHPLIEYAASKKKPIIFSTGMSEIHEIEETVDILKKYDVPFAMTHCTSIYPCPPDMVNLRVIRYLIEKFKVPIGLSDHTDNIFSSFGAIAHGACIIEKHFTLNRSLVGPDHKSSIEPHELKQLVEGCNIIYKSNGSLKKIFDEEKQILAWARESVVTEKDLFKHDELSINNIWVKRPAPINGVIEPRDYKKILGRKVNKNIKKDTQLKWEDLC